MPNCLSKRRGYGLVWIDRCDGILITRSELSGLGLILNQQLDGKAGKLQTCSLNPTQLNACSFSARAHLAYFTDLILCHIGILKVCEGAIAHLEMDLSSR